MHPLKAMNSGDAKDQQTFLEIPDDGIVANTVIVFTQKQGLKQPEYFVINEKIESCLLPRTRLKELEHHGIDSKLAEYRNQLNRSIIIVSTILADIRTKDIVSRRIKVSESFYKTPQYVGSRSV